MSFRVSGHYIFKFSRDNVPVLRIQSGETVEIETQDCFSNQLKYPEDNLEKIDWERINPASGPIYVEDALEGDVLKVIILDMVLADQGIMASGENLGVLGEFLRGIESRIIPVRDGMAIFDSRLSIPLSPMIGVIGVAPKGEGINCGTPGSHGGNMDNLMITKGAVLYFPVYTKGALFALGDLHAVMGDGEIGVTGVEAAGRVKVKLEVIKNLTIKNPVLENKDSFTTIASAAALDDAVRQSVIDMADILKTRIPLSLGEAAMLMSAAGHTQICQVVDPLKTARFVMPKWVLEKYDFKFQVE